MSISITNSTSAINVHEGDFLDLQINASGYSGALTYDIDGFQFGSYNGASGYNSPVSWLTNLNWSRFSGRLTGYVLKTTPGGGNPYATRTLIVHAYDTTGGGTEGNAGVANKTITYHIRPAVGINHLANLNTAVNVAISAQTIISTETATYTVGSLPPGLSFDGMATISGTPTATGTFTVAITGVSAYGSESYNWIVSVLPVPTVTGIAAVTAVTGRRFNYPFTITPSATSPLTIANLPAGVTLNASGNGLTGIPTTVAVYSTTIQGTNATGSGPVFTATITVVDPPTIESATSPDGAASGFHFSSSASQCAIAVGSNSGVVYNVVCSDGSVVSASHVPYWLTFANGGTDNIGIITVSDTVPSSVPFITLTATAAGISVSQILTVVAYYPMAFDDTHNRTDGIVTGTNIIACKQGKSFQFEAHLNQYGEVFSNDSPSWVKISPLGAIFLITGTPPTSEVTPLRIFAKGQYDSAQNVYAVIAAPAPDVTITSPNTATCQVGIDGFRYAITSTTTGIPATMFGADGLPDGLTLTGNIIAGTATTSGFYAVTIQAGNNTTTGFSDLLITVTPPPVLSITSSLQVSLVVNTAFSYYITTDHTAASYTFGTLPDGITQIGTSQFLTGSPTSIGSTEVSISATGPLGTDSQNLIISVTPPPAIVITSADTDTATQDQLYIYQVTSTPTGTSFSASSLPDGLSINSATGVVSGAPFVSGGVVFVVTATDGITTASQRVTLTIAPSVVSHPDSAGVALVLYCELTNLIVSTSNTLSSQQIDDLTVISGCGRSIKVVATINGNPTLLPEKAVVYFDLKRAGQFSGSSIISASSTGYSIDDKSYLLTPDFTSAELTSLLDLGGQGIAELAMSSQISWQVPGGSLEAFNMISTTLKNSVRLS